MKLELEILDMIDQLKAELEDARSKKNQAAVFGLDIQIITLE